ncbi:hypothetical protein N5D66_28065 [Delftia tsuruhatensis]|jgi:hypothetical protein|uniref:hypothetical protein n=1 Tax=Delftia tsuruhatensis TaxID=180282 RepID=UPI00244C1402|nr:hypothetical protein [Delftia tsuruhatensis]MDH0851821.1 hypothetical protein [Delftia tsuruhatensis]
MTTSSSSFRVTLQDCIGMKADTKAKAEARFAKVLERSFPNHEAMARAFKLFSDAAEGGIIGKANESIAISWQKAYEAARQAGLQGVTTEEAYFDVRLH